MSDFAELTNPRNNGYGYFRTQVYFLTLCSGTYNMNPEVGLGVVGT